MAQNVREEVANVALSQILEDYGMESVSLVQLDGDIPDVYLVERGVRCILAMKREGKRKELTEQMGDRLDEGLCEVVFGVVFPNSVTHGGINPPSVNEVTQNLRDVDLEILIQAISSDNEITRIRPLTVPQLPETISRYASDALDEEELDQAVERVSSSVADFVSKVGRHQNSESIAANIEEVLEGVE